MSERRPTHLHFTRMKLIPPILLLIVAAGCRPVPQGRPPYDGPTEPLVAVVQKINANNGKIRTVWAQHDFEAMIVDAKGKSHAFSGSGTLQFRKPGDLLLKARGVIDFFDVGANAETFWFTAFPAEVSTQWWGRRENFTGTSAGRSGMPIRPDLLGEVLGVHEIDTDFTRAPVPVLRFNNDEDAYMITWNAPVQDPARWAVLKEVWYDRKTLRPRVTLLFDENGRIVLRAYTDPTRYKQIEGTDAWMPGRYDLYFPENKSQMTFTLTTVKPSHKPGKIVFPNDNTFTLPTDPGVEKRIEIR
ncbi:MAG TPA: hypothetical protein VEA69_18050 [Tepidisphaeraceae bacterium]|nr:hypothetical protein [Tepidisphaeraceae bacterium]